MKRGPLMRVCALYDMMMRVECCRRESYLWMLLLSTTAMMYTHERRIRSTAAIDTVEATVESQ